MYRVRVSECVPSPSQLFALKSQMTHFTDMDDFNHDLLQFPPLMWVVQDFHLSQLGAETPKDWLLRLMASSSRDDEYEINLKGVGGGGVGGGKLKHCTLCNSRNCYLLQCDLSKIIFQRLSVSPRHVCKHHLSYPLPPCCQEGTSNGPITGGWGCSQGGRGCRQVGGAADRILICACLMSYLCAVHRGRTD